jgi:hypothetical protein
MEPIKRSLLAVLGYKVFNNRCDHVKGNFSGFGRFQLLPCRGGDATFGGEGGNGWCCPKPALSAPGTLLKAAWMAGHCGGGIIVKTGADGASTFTGLPPSHADTPGAHTADVRTGSWYGYVPGSMPAVYGSPPIRPTLLGKIVKGDCVPGGKDCWMTAG